MPMIKDLIQFSEFMKLDLRVGQVMEAQAVDGSDKLLQLVVDLGDELGKRQILAGLAKWYHPEDLVKKKVVVVANLASKKMMGLESQGMILAAGETDLALLTLMKDLPVGSPVR